MVFKGSVGFINTEQVDYLCRQRKKTKIPPAEYPAILALYESGNTAAAIAAIYKVTESGILSVLNRLGVKRRHSADYVAMGSDRHPTKGKGHTDAAKAKIRAANQRQFATNEAREQAASRQRAAMASGKIAAVSALEGIVNGMITNDKFCCTRRDTLQLSWWRRPLRLRQ